MLHAALGANLPFTMPASPTGAIDGVVYPAFIDNAWVLPASYCDRFQMVDPRTEKASGEIAFADNRLLDRAVDRAAAAFPAFAVSDLGARLEILRRFRKIYESNQDLMARAIAIEIGAPYEFSYTNQALAGLLHIDETIKAAERLDFEAQLGSTLIVREPVGVAALITPWNWPANQVACKVAPAIAAGCSMVLKPSEYAPLSACLFAAMLKEAGLPDGVLNVVFGAGPTIGAMLAAHPAIDVVSFTGSHRGGVAVAEAAAPTIKRVVQELGGKSANILAADLEGSALAQAVTAGIFACFLNTGQSCDSPSRMLVPIDRLDDVECAAKEAAESVTVGVGNDDYCGPLVNAAQFNRVQMLIEKAVSEGARLVAGGTGRPVGCDAGFFVKPTVFSGVTPDMTIAREEVFGPVLSIIAYENENDAVAIANDSAYGLSGCVTAASHDRAVKIARRLRTGMVLVNDAALPYDIPFGGFKQSGNGREWGAFGIEEFLETKAIIGAIV